jgi:hypothetical protein
MLTAMPEKKKIRKTWVSLKENLDAEQESLPSDGPVSQSEGTTAPDLDSNLERDDPADLRQDSSPV